MSLHSSLFCFVSSESEKVCLDDHWALEGEGSRVVEVAGLKAALLDLCVS